MSLTSYPDQQIRLVAPFPPGHVSDLHARLLAPHVAEALHQPVSVENWPGASGTVALGRLKDAAPDGYTLMMHGYGGLAVTPHLVEVTYDPTTDLTPVVKLMTGPLVLVVNPALPVNSAQELIAFARDNPGKVRGGSFGNGSNSHLALILLNRSTGLEIPHTAYPGGFETTSDLVTRNFDLMFEFLPVLMRHIAAGYLKPLAVTGKRRSTALPDIPTLEETGIRGVGVVGWQGIIGPRGLSPEIVDTLNRALQMLRTSTKSSAAWKRTAISSRPARRKTSPHSSTTSTGAGERSSGKKESAWRAHSPGAALDARVRCGPEGTLGKPTTE